MLLCDKVVEPVGLIAPHAPAAAGNRKGGRAVSGDRTGFRRAVSRLAA